MKIELRSKAWIYKKEYKIFFNKKIFDEINTLILS